MSKSKASKGNGGIIYPAVTIIPVKPPVPFHADLNYITPRQLRIIIDMFDTPEAYAENFSALKAIARGLYNLIQDKGFHNNNQIERMFHAVNNLQGILYPEDPEEGHRILQDSGLMPDPWQQFRSPKGGASCA